ncbi:oligosaccharide flippase family protein [Patiriisocius sp. Uisw_017]|uniref:oligosaccharide flippase family protein n=1 Tax=Patiriisocius sp. Uisw_017 TaxID=3230968 RepID=UPI0039E7B0E7
MSAEALWVIIKMLIFGVPLFALNKTINNFMTGLREIKIDAIVRVIRWSTIILLVVYVRAADLPFKSIAYSFICSEVLILSYFFIKTRKYWGKIDFKWVYKHLSFVIKSVMEEFVATFNTRIPILIIGYSLGDEAAGY